VRLEEALVCMILLVRLLVRLLVPVRQLGLLLVDRELVGGQLLLLCGQCDEQEQERTNGRHQAEPELREASAAPPLPLLRCGRFSRALLCAAPLWPTHSPKHSARPQLAASSRSPLWVHLWPLVLAQTFQHSPSADLCLSLSLC